LSTNFKTIKNKFKSQTLSLIFRILNLFEKEKKQWYYYSNKGVEMKKIVLLVFSFSFITFASIKTEVSSGGPSASEVLKYKGPKARIAVGRFEVKAAKAGWEIGEGIKDMLIDSLFNTGRFIVLEKGETMSDLKEEYQLGESGWSKKAPKKGTFETADIILTGAITAFEPDYKKKGGGGVVIPLPFKIGGGVKIEKKEAYIAAHLRLVDVRTRRIIKTAKVDGYASKSNIGIVGGGLIGTVALGAGFQKYKNTPMEKAVMVMLENAVKEIIKSVPENYYRYGENENLQTAKKEETPSLKIIGGEDIFKGGQVVLFDENFNNYEIGDVPVDFLYEKAGVEIAKVGNKKWMRFLKEGSVKKKLNINGDYSFEISFLTTFNCLSNIKLPDGKSMQLVNGKILYSGVELAPIKLNKVNRIQISKRKGITKIFINGKKEYKTVEKSTPTGNEIAVKCGEVNPDEGKEFLFTDLKISLYK